MALVVTAGALNADSYATLEQTDVYIEQSGYDTETWDELEDEQKEFRLKQAALLMNNIPYRGAKACRDQRLEFPRWWYTDEGYPSYDDVYITTADILAAGYLVPVVPAEVKEAQIHFAFHVIHNGIMAMESVAYPEREIKAFALGGSLEIEFSDRPATAKSVLDKARLSSLDPAYYMLQKWIKRVSGGVV